MTRYGELIEEVGPTGELVVIFSATKGLVAICLLLLIERGLLELDRPVAFYWPEFRHRDVLVRHVVSHTAGLPGLRPPPGRRELLDGGLLAARRLAIEPPLYPPGEVLVYHGLTFGWLCGELVRRIDGRSIGTFFADEIARPLDLEIWLGGLPQELESRVVPLPAHELFTRGSGDPLLVEALYGILLEEFPWNEEAFHRVEIPAGNAIANARSLALLYGRLDRILRPETIELGGRELSRGPCVVTGYPYAFGVGFELQTELRSFGPPPAAFGHDGAGGGVHGLWPDERISFSYLPTELRSSLTDDRARLLLDDLYARLVRSS